MATTWARAAGSENQAAASSPRPSEMPSSAAGASWRPAAQRARLRATGPAIHRATAPSPSGPASRTRTPTPRSLSSPSRTRSSAGAARRRASDSAASASAPRSAGSTTRAPPVCGACVPLPVKAAVPPAPSSRARTSSGGESSPTQMRTRSPAARAAAATVSRPGPARSAASTRRTPRAASWPRSLASGRPASAGSPAPGLPSCGSSVRRVLPATRAAVPARPARRAQPYSM